MKFHYRAITASGEETTGVFEAEHRGDVARRLEKQGLIPFEISDRTVQPSRRMLQSRKPPRRELLMALHELTTLIESDVPLAEAVGSLAGSSHHPAICNSFERMSSQLKRGEGFASALEQAKLDLPWYFGELARAGELTGRLGESLRRGVAQMEYELEMAAELRGALVYPSILILTGLIAVLVVFMVVVPNFSGMVELDDPALPWLAWAIISAGNWFNAHAAAVTLGLLAAAGAISAALSRESTRLSLLQSLSRAPVIGQWLREAETGRWTAMMATLLGSRVELAKALSMAQSSVRLNNLQARLEQVTKTVRAGTPLSEALQDHEAITATGCDLVAVGEKTGKMPQMLESLARLYQTTGRERAKRTLQLIEPLAILIIGAAIGLIITGVVLAITASQDLGI